jgi:hypothetical protein
MGSNEFTPREGPSVLGKRGASPGSNVLSPKKGPSSPRNNHVLNCFVITTLSHWFSYKLVTYNWKGLDVGYKFEVKNVSIKIHMKKIKS